MMTPLGVVGGPGHTGHGIFERAGAGLDSVLIAVGLDGGLIRAALVGYQGGVRVIGVEPEGERPTLHKSLAAGRVVEVDTEACPRDSLGARRVGDLSFPIAQDLYSQNITGSGDEHIVEGPGAFCAAVGG